MVELHCQPVTVFPIEAIGFSSCEVIPGVKISAIRPDLHAAMSEMIQGSGDQTTLRYVPRLGIFVNKDKYLSHLKKRLANEGKNLSRIPQNENIPEYIDTQSIARQVIISWVILAGVSFELGDSFWLRVDNKDGTKRYRFMSRQGMPVIGSYRTTMGLFEPRIEPPLAGYKLKRIAVRLDRYYRHGNYWTDRLGMALGFFWNAMCTSSHDHTFVGLTMALEAVLSTDQVEITHQLAERAAVLLGDSATDRRDIYRQVKQLYGIRSRLVHGQAYPKRGPVNVESLAVMAKYINVPHSQTKNLMSLTMRLLTKLIFDKEYTGIIWTERNEGQTNERIRELFVERLFR